MKALAKRPIKLFDALMKGDSTIHDLKKIGKCSGGFIRTLVWAGVAVINDDKTIKFVKGIKKSDLPDLEEEAPAKKSKTKVKEKPAKSGRLEKKRRQEEEEEEEEDERPRKKKRSRDDDEDEDDKPVRKDKGKEAPAKKRGKDDNPKILETRMVKLIKPVTDIPANMKIKGVRKDDGFWWVEGKRIATSNLTFVK